MITARHGTPGDVTAVTALVEAAFSRHVAAVGRRPAPMDDDHASRAASGSQHVLVDDDGTIVAAVVITQHADHVELNNVAVDPSRQGQGLGRRLVELAAELGRKAGVAEIRLYTNARMADNLLFYPALGFKETERRTSGGYDRVYFRRGI